MKPRGLMRAVLEQYVLAPDGIHGVSHWARVCAAGRHLAEAAAVDPGAEPAEPGRFGPARSRSAPVGIA